MTKKIKIISSVLGVVLVIGFIWALDYKSAWSAAGLSKYHIENWYGNIQESEEQEQESALGVAEFASGRIVFDNLADSVLQRKTIVVSPSQINELSDDENGVELLPAVGTSYVQELVSITGFTRYVSEAWSRAGGEGFEVKWNSGLTASGGNGGMNLGASFSQGFFSSGANPGTASPSVEIWYPYNPSDFTETSTGRGRIASSSAIHLSGLVDPSNVETSNITDFVFEVVYRIWPNY